MQSDVNFSVMLWLSLGAIGITAFRQWQQGSNRVGLVFLYLLALFQYYWLPTAFYKLAWYIPIFPSSLVKTGFREFFIGSLSFAVGVLFVAPLLGGKLRRPWIPDQIETHRITKLPRIYTTIGFIAFLILTPLLARVPSIASVVSNWTQLTIVGITLGCWLAWQTDNRIALMRWLLLAVSWPLFTVALFGFLGLGLDLLLTVLIFCFQFTRRPLRLIIPVSIVTYLVLSLYITYMGSRQALRSVVWNETATITQKANVVYANLKAFQWFSIYNPTHLYYIDARSGQIPFTGMAVYRLSTGVIKYAQGDTLVDAVFMMVPRVLWPNKPIRLGGNSDVAYYTGLSFQGSTSVAMGPLLELYINFGSMGVFIGFLISGVVVALVDEVAALNLQSGNGKGFAFWYLIGLGLIELGNTFVAISGTTISAAVAIIVFNRFLLPLLLPADQQTVCTRRVQETSTASV